MKKLLLLAMLSSISGLHAQQQDFTKKPQAIVNGYHQTIDASATMAKRYYGVLIVEGVLSQSRLAQLASLGLVLEGVYKQDYLYSHYFVSSQQPLNVHQSALSKHLSGYHSLSLYQRPATTTPTSKQAQDYQLTFFRSVSPSLVKQILQSHKIKFEHYVDQSYIASLTTRQLSALRQYQAIQLIDVFKKTALTNDIARERSGVNAAQASISFDNIFPPDNAWLDEQPYTGNHIDVGVYDTGIDKSHWDFREVTLDVNGDPILGFGAEYYDGKLTNLRTMQCGSQNTPSCSSFYDYQVDQHGTHVAGIIGGNGWNSAAQGFSPYQLRGVAPKVNFWSVDFTSTWSQGDRQGHVTNHSHKTRGNGSGANYDTVNADIDSAINSQKRSNGSIASPDGRIKTVVYAAGNQNDRKGYYSLLVQAKNPVVVGNASKTSGKLYNTSSMGPTIDGRIKPDIIAPGADQPIVDPTAANPVKVYIDDIRLERSGGQSIIHYNFNHISLQGWQETLAAQNINAVQQGGALYYEKIAGLSAISGPNIDPAHIADDDDRLIIRYKIEWDPSLPATNKIAGNFFWFEAPNHAGSSARSLPLEFDVTGQYETLSVNLSNIGHTSAHNWTAGNPIHAIRFDFNRPTDINKDIISTIAGNVYGGNAGTSMSAPHVTGIIALMLEKFGHKILACPLGEDCADLDRLGPSNALVRALLIHTATDLENDANDQSLMNPDIIDSDTVYHRGPDFATGWGLVNAQKALEYIDPAKITVINRLQKDQVKRFHFRVGENAGPLRITATWDDAGDFSTSGAQPRLINDVDIHLIAPNGDIFYPWQLEPLPTGLMMAADVKPASNTCAVDLAVECYDHLNNVEVIDVDTPQYGDWQLVVNAYDVDFIEEVSLVSDYELVADDPQCWNVVSWSVDPDNSSMEIAEVEPADCTIIPAGKVYSRRLMDSNYLLFDSNDPRIIFKGPFSMPLVFYGYEKFHPKHAIVKTKPACESCGVIEEIYPYPPKQGEINFEDVVRLRDPDTQFCLAGAQSNGSVIQSKACQEHNEQLFKLVDRGNNQFYIKSASGNQCLYAHSNSGAYVKSWVCHNNLQWIAHAQGRGARLEYVSKGQCIKGGSSVLTPSPHDACDESAELQYQVDIVERWPSVTLQNDGNADSSLTQTLVCAATGESCTVTGNREHHQGPRTCTMYCPQSSLLTGSCTTSHNNRDITDFQFLTGFTTGTQICQYGQNCAIDMIVGVENITTVCDVTD